VALINIQASTLSPGEGDGDPGSRTSTSVWLERDLRGPVGFVHRQHSVFGTDHGGAGQKLLEVEDVKTFDVMAVPYLGNLHDEA
jgi:hypothetical protein